MNDVPPPSSIPPPPPPLTPPFSPATPDFSLPRFPGDRNLRLRWAAPFWEGKIPVNKMYIGVIAVGAVLAVILLVIGMAAICKANFGKIRYDSEFLISILSGTFFEIASNI